jgi:hypothetical protein
MSDVTYPSRIDAWLIVLIGGTIGIVLTLALASYSHSPSESLLSLGVLAATLLFSTLVGYPCNYTLTDAQLVIRSGLVRQRIAYRDITAIEASRSPWAAPALSLRRVKVSFSGRFQLVSPRERERFIDDLRRGVIAAGGRLMEPRP